MAKKISELPSMSEAEDNDVLPIVDVSETVTKKIGAKDLVDSIPVTNIAVGAVKRINLSSNVLLKVQGNSYNPLPTSETDVVNGSTTFTLEEPANLFVVWGGRFQQNNNATCYLNLKVDGTNTSEPVIKRQTLASSFQNHISLSRTDVLFLDAGEHTLKLTIYNTTSSSSVLYSPYMNGVFSSQVSA